MPQAGTSVEHQGLTEQAARGFKVTLAPQHGWDVLSQPHPGLCTAHRLVEKDSGLDLRWGVEWQEGVSSADFEMKNLLPLHLSHIYFHIFIPKVFPLGIPRHVYFYFSNLLFFKTHYISGSSSITLELTDIFLFLELVSFTW